MGTAGTTLVEVIVASMLGMFALLGVQVAWWNSSRVVVQATSQLDLQRDASFVLDSVSDAARTAASFTIQDYGTKTANLVIIKNAGGTELSRFYWNPTDNKLYASKSGGAASAFIASPVNNLSFTASGKELTMNLTLKDTWLQVASYVTTVWLRN